MQVHAFNVLDTGYGPGGRATTVSDLLLKIAPQSFDLGFLESELAEIYVVGLSEISQLRIPASYITRA